ncbi:MAG: hypothetical protein RBS05_21445 [Zoogloea oleivorans]|uniref:hypothetical protein n=1 Tax=Zoogloea oleivorans TaxID=1552750 RepID=UPI002A3643E3|nr:hypothetical protein [Zoogloea oleivorans]MDY0038478.1 hypothetical protein [Zoogloea oleivorans]
MRIAHYQPWHDLRRFLNESVHDEQAPSADEAREVMDFTRMLIDLLYAYAARIKRSRTAKTDS